MISVCIVNYKTKDITLKAIESIENLSTGTEFEIVLVDNGSGANDVNGLLCYSSIYENVMFYSSAENIGYSKANNLAIRIAKGNYIALLNSDTEITSDSFTKAVNYLNDNPDIGAVSCRLITPDGQLDHGCKRGFPTPKASLFYFLKVHKWLNRPELDLYRLGHLDEHQIHDVDVISGAFMVLPRKVIDEIGLLDERFFMYGEDIDWCYRIKEAGYRIVYNPELGDVIHYKGASGKKRKFKTLFNFYEAMILFYNKHYLKKYNVLVTICVYLGILLQFVLKLIWNYRPRLKR